MLRKNVQPILQCRVRCILRKFSPSYCAVLGEPYDRECFHGTINFNTNPSPPGQGSGWNLKPSANEG